MNLFAALNHWIHLSSVIFWMGGVLFQLFIVAPFLKTDLPPPGYLIALSNRFQKVISPIILILIITGGLNIGLRRAGHEALPPGYVSALGVKILLVAGVASIHLFSMIHLQKNDLPDRTLKTLPGQPYIGWTFVLGIIIIFIAAILRHWAF